MGALPPVFIEFLGSATGFMATAKGVKTELATVEAEGGGNMRRMGGVAKAALLGIGVAAGVAAVKTVHMAADFQTQMTRVRTGAGEAAKNMGLVSNGVLNMAGRVGESTKDLTAGLYMVESAGFHGSAALKVLETSAMGAKVGAADLATVTDAVTTAMNAYKLGASDTTTVMNALVGTEAEGKTNLEALAGSMSGILPVAAAAHVKLNEVLGAMATMTSQGTDARVSATYLRQTIGQLSNPSAKAAATMKGLGLDANKVSHELGTKGLAATLNTLTDAIKSKMGPGGDVLIKTLQKASKSSKDFEGALNKASGSKKTYIGALATMVGGTKSMMGALQLTGPHMSTFQKNVDGISKHVKDGGKHVEGWADVQQTFNQRMAEFKGTAEAIGIRIGNNLLPAATKLFGVLTQGLMFLASHSVYLKVFGVLLGGVTLGLAAASLASWSFTDSLLANPITWVVAGIIALIAGLTLLIVHWKQVWGWIKTNIPAVAHAFKATWDATLRGFHATWAFTVKAVQALVKWFNANVLTWLKARMKDFSGWWKSHSTEIKETWALLWASIKTEAKIAWAFLSAGFEVLKGSLKLSWDLISGIVKTAWAIISGAVTTGMHEILNIVAVVMDVLTGHWGKAWQDLKKLASQAFHDTVSAIQSITSSFGSLLTSAGADLIRGLINGIGSMGGAVGKAISDIAHGVVSTAKSILGIKSPSRVFRQIGIWVNEGLIQGLTGSTSRVESAIKSTLTKLMNAYNAVADQKGRKGVSNRWVAQHEAAIKHLETYVRKEGAQLDKLAKQRDSVAKRLKSAQANLKNLQKEWADERNNIASGIMQGTSIVMQPQDDGAAITAGDVLANMQDQAAKALKFSNELAALKKKGLRADLIEQIAAAGVDQGGATADALMSANSAQIAQLNTTQKSLKASANSTGAVVADAMYKAGIDSAKGLIKGLQSKEKAIEKQMEKIGKAMAKAIKRELGIRSPSRVFHEIGAWIPAGLVNGVDSGMSAVQRAAKRMSAALIAGASTPELGSSGTGTTSVVHAVHIEVHGSVHSDRDLRDVVQSEMLRYGARNSVTYQQFRR
ncbi:phage tail tape measure protein [Streptomyces sp. NPDC006655]|uniref:phage tail tape measure protein n=1 Tax=Streptomyces sp. NPDC006655 TaxID=3156898 RepID=UPI0034562716